MPHNQTMARSALFFVASLMTLGLTACDQTWLATQPPTPLVRLQVERPPVDPSQLQCQSRPQPPKAGTQADVAVYVRELDAWGAECESKLADVREMLRPTTKGD